MDKAEVEKRKLQLQIRINSNEFWLRSEQGMSNQMKIKRRKKDLKICKKELIELNKLYPINNG